MTRAWRWWLGGLVLLAAASAKAIAFFLIPLTMGVSVTLLMTVGAMQEMWPSDAPSQQLGQQALKVTFQGQKSGSGEAVTYEVPASLATSASQSLTKGEQVPGWRMAGALNVHPSEAIDGVWHYLPNGVYETQEASVAAAVAAYNAVAKPEYLKTAGPCWVDGEGSPRCAILSELCTVASVCGVLMEQGSLIERADGVRRLQLTAGGVALDTTDPDYTAAEKAEGASVGAGPMVFQSADQITEVSADSAGNLQLGQAVQQGPVVRRVITIFSAGDGGVQSVSDGSTPGSLALEGAAGLGAPGAAVGGSGTGSGWPSDYARTGESASAATALGDRLMGGQDVADPADKGSQEWTGFGTSFDSLTGWTVPGHASVCPAPSVDLFGQTYVMDQHCTIMADHSAALEAAMLVFWTLSALFVVLKA